MIRLTILLAALALAAGGRLAAQGPSDPLLYQAGSLVQAAQAASRVGDAPGARAKLREAQTAYEAYRAARPNDVAGYAGAAQCLAKMRYLATASDALVLAYQIAPTEPQVLYDLAASLYNQSRYQETLRYWRKLIELAATDNRVAQRPEIHYFRGAAASKLGLTPEAITAFKQALAVDPTDLEAREGLAGEYLNAGRYAEAIPEFEELIRRDPSDTLHRYHLGVCHLQIGDLELAEEILSKARRLNPNHADTWIKLGKLYMRQKEFDRAYTFYLRAIELNPRAHPAYYALARLASIKGHADDAESYRGKYEEIQREVDELTERMREYNRRVLADPGDREAYLEAALLLIQENKLLDAQEWLVRLLVHDPDHELAILNVAKILSSNGLHELAFMEVSKILDRNPRHPYATLDAGRYLMMLGQSGAAIPLFEASLQTLDRSRGEVHAMLASACARRAQELMAQARALGATARDETQRDRAQDMAFEAQNLMEKARENGEAAKALGIEFGPPGAAGERDGR